MTARVSARSSSGTEAQVYSNRRAHKRLKATEVPWLRRARLKHGSDVRVIDISMAGVLVESRAPLQPGTEVVFELTGVRSTVVVPARILRCHGIFAGDSLRHSAACAFTQPLPIGDLVNDVGPKRELISDVRHAVDSIVHALEFPQEAPPVALGDAAPAASAGWQKIVVKYRDGRMLRGYTNNFHASRSQLHLSEHPHQGSPVFVPVMQLKAVFFVRTFAGNPSHDETKRFARPSNGRRLEVTFHDDEVLVGSTLSYRHDGHGFFVFPADPQSNNLRVFVVVAAVRQVRFL